MPVDTNDGGAEYKKWEKGTEWSSKLNTKRSPKDFFFPQTENLMEFKTSGKSIEIIDTRTAKEDFVVFGVRACDAKAFEILDRVFLTEPRDSYYASAREHGTIVTVACGKPSETCFCTAFGIDPSVPQGDVSAWKTDKEIFLQANTEKGEKLLSTVAHLTEEADENAVKEEKEKIKEGVKSGLEGLKDKVPGIVEICVQTEALATSNADLMLDSLFESEEALKNYATHPAHVEVANTAVRPYMEQRLCLDFTV